MTEPVPALPLRWRRLMLGMDEEMLALGIGFSEGNGRRRSSRQEV
jgi:hypothetical protein